MVKKIKVDIPKWLAACEETNPNECEQGISIRAEEAVIPSQQGRARSNNSLKTRVLMLSVKANVIRKKSAHQSSFFGKLIPTNKSRNK